MLKYNRQYKDDLVGQPTSPTPDSSGDRIADEENRV